MKAMNATKKMFALMLAFIMMLALGVTASAAGTGTITISNATAGNIYTVYKVFDASGNGTNISYTLVDGKTSAPEGFTVDDAGNVTYTGSGANGELTDDDIAAIAEYVVESDIVATATAEGDTVTISGLANGYYYITTTTGTVVTITSTNPDAKVVDKNEAPELDKTITGVTDGSIDEDGLNAIAQVGSTITYTVTIDVNDGATNYVFHDVMSTGLSYNDDVKVYVGETEITAGEGTYDATTVEGDTITITFDNDWIATQVDSTITITYTATVTSEALTVDSVDNTASIDYGDNNTVTTKTSPKVYTATFEVTKVDGSNEALAGAGFVLATTNDEGETVYYSVDESGVVSWVNDIDDATVLTTTDESNVVTFTGLADGTYTLIETVVPDGYNKAADSTFTIVAGDYTEANLEQTTRVVNLAGSTLPSTGGMGTTILYAVGAALVIGAGVVLVVRRRMSAE